jgi:DNA-binding GntR family transcriptional regulator
VSAHPAAPDDLAERPVASPVLALQKPQNLAETIYRDLRARLRSGDLDPATRLVDLELARAYGTSRSPAREALVRLANEGFLEGSSRGFVPARLSLEDIRDVFEVRKLLEPQAAGAAAPLMNDANIETLIGLAAAAQFAADRRDAPALAMANVAFRDLWLAATPNRRLSETITRFADHVWAVRRMTLADPDTQKVVAKGLSAMAQAFQDRNEALAFSETTHFIAAAEQAFYVCCSRPVPEPVL